jgi:hypothetical protein
MEFRYLPFYHFFTHKERDEFAHMTVGDVSAIQSNFMGMVSSLAAFGKSIGARQQIKVGQILPAKSPPQPKRPGPQKA